MELEGLKRGLEGLKVRGVKVVNVVTDRHSMVKKYMRENHGDKKHGFDVWHVASGKFDLFSCIKITTKHVILSEPAALLYY